jgi:hypothetical protein
MSRRVWVPPPPGPDDPHPCHCAGEWFNPRFYSEGKRCRVAYTRALRVVRQVFPGARVIAAPGIPQTEAGEGPARERKP